MAESIWKPHVTVAAICERDNRYLLVKEKVDGRIVYNQPAGHLEPGETLLDAVVRETLEETGYEFRPLGLQGIYRFCPGDPQTLTYIRFLFRGNTGERVADELDGGIIAAEWLSFEEIQDCRDQHRSPMVMQCIADSRRHPGYPLDIINQGFA